MSIQPLQAYFHHTLALLHDTYGYDAILQELHTIQRIRAVEPAALGLAPASSPVPPVANSSVAKDVATPPKDSKPKKTRRPRMIIPDEIRCEAILPNQQRCSLTKNMHSDYCTHHIKRYGVEAHNPQPLHD